MISIYRQSSSQMRRRGLGMRMKTNVGIYVGNGGHCNAPLQCQRYLLSSLKSKETEFQIEPYTGQNVDILHIQQIPTGFLSLFRTLRPEKVISHVHGDLEYTYPRLSVHGPLRRKYISSFQRLSKRHMMRVIMMEWRNHYQNRCNRY